MLVNATPTLVGTGGPHRPVLIPKLAPDTQYLQTFGIVGINQKAVSHSKLLSLHVVLQEFLERHCVVVLLIMRAVDHSDGSASCGLCDGAPDVGIRLQFRKVASSKFIPFSGVVTEPFTQRRARTSFFEPTVEGQGVLSDSAWP